MPKVGGGLHSIDAALGSWREVFNAKTKSGLIKDIRTVTHERFNDKSRGFFRQDADCRYTAAIEANNATAFARLSEFFDYFTKNRSEKAKPREVMVIFNEESLSFNISFETIKTGKGLADRITDLSNQMVTSYQEFQKESPPPEQPEPPAVMSPVSVVRPVWQDRGAGTGGAGL